MPRDIIIGGATDAPLPSEPDRFPPDAEVTVVQWPEAPVFPGDGVTGSSNRRQPSLGNWEMFLRDTGLKNLFDDPNRGLTREISSVFPFGEEHLSVVRGAREEWERSHPGSVPGWDPHAEDGDEGEEEEAVATEGLDGDLARLLWIEWWMEWSLRNCAHPAIENS